MGLQIDRNGYGDIRIHQQAYANSILSRFGLAECNPVSTPVMKVSESQESGKDITKKFPYREAVGTLMYPMLGTRPDLAFSVGVLSRTPENPTDEDISKLKRFFRYVKGTTHYGITYKSNKKCTSLECYSDSDFSGCTKTCRSTSGVVINYAGGVISWFSQRQSSVSTSTTEAELRAAHEATKEIIWLNRLFRDIKKLEQRPILQVDNVAAVRLTLNPELHRRTKHIRTKYFFIREMVNHGKLCVQNISTKDQVADIMTKPLPKARLQTLCEKMGLR